MMDYAGRVAKADTFPKLLRLNAREHGSEIALREKNLGLWTVFTWNDYQRRVHDFALGLVELGRLVGASPHHLSRVFRDEVGVPVSLYRRRLRLRQVKRLKALHAAKTAAGAKAAAGKGSK